MVLSVKSKHACLLHMVIDLPKHSVYSADMEQINQIDKAISTVGSLSALSELLGESPQTVSNWRSRQVPADRCPSIERATHGAVRCEELRPDVDWAYLRGTKKKAA